MAVISKGQTFATGDQVTASKLNNLADNATFASGAVDNVSTQLSGGAIIVRDGGITPAKLSAGAPTWGTNGIHSLPSNGVNGSVGLEINDGVSGNGSALIDFHSTSATNPDRDARILKNSGENSDFHIENYGTGNIVFIQNDAQVMRIDSDGRLGIGTLQTVGFGGSTNKINVEYDTTPGYHMVFNDTRTDGSAGAGVFHFFRGGNEVGSISSTPNSIAYNTSSDYRLKEDIVDITDSIERLKALKPCNFAWKSDGTRADGFIAHEAQEVVPEAVTGVKDAVDAEGKPKYQGIDQAKLVPLLTKALQGAVAKIEALEARVAALES